MINFIENKKQDEINGGSTRGDLHEHTDPSVCFSLEEDSLHLARKRIPPIVNKRNRILESCYQNEQQEESGDSDGDDASFCCVEFDATADDTLDNHQNDKNDDGHKDGDYEIPLRN